MTVWRSTLLRTEPAGEVASLIAYLEQQKERGDGDGQTRTTTTSTSRNHKEETAAPTSRATTLFAELRRVHMDLPAPQCDAAAATRACEELEAAFDDMNQQNEVPLADLQRHVPMFAAIQGEGKIGAVYELASAPRVGSRSG